MDWPAFLISLFFAMGCAPLAFFPGQSGCFCCTSPCELCTSTPQSVQIVLAGITNNACLSCGSLNGTFITDPADNNFNGTTSCQWVYTLPSRLCTDYDFITTRIVPASGGLISVRILGNALTSELSWSVGLTGNDACASWSNLNLPNYGAARAACNHVTISTANITAV